MDIEPDDKEDQIDYENYLSIASLSEKKRGGEGEIYSPE